MTIYYAQIIPKRAQVTKFLPDQLTNITIDNSNTEKCTHVYQNCLFLFLELLGSEDEDPMMNMLVRPTDAENISGLPIRSNIGIKSNKISSSHTSITTESQTQTSRNFGYEDIDKETNQLSMDIETQTSTIV